MPTKGKYVVGEMPLAVGTMLTAVCFHEAINHSDMKKLFVGEPLGAGFFHIDQDKVWVYGESVSLNLKSRPEDSRHISRVLGLQD